MTRLGTRAVAAALVAFGLVVPAGAAAATETPVSITFSDGTHGQPITTVANDGTGATTQALVTAGGGNLGGRWSRIKTGLAARFPAYDGTAGGQRAVVSVTNSGSRDDLSPGAKEFTFGADAKINATSTGTANDNGNNLLQRGLSNQSAQYKLQMDGTRFSCRVKGDGGTIMVTSPVRVRASTWYHVTCTRRVSTSGDYLVLKMSTVNADGTRTKARKTTSSKRSIGRLSFARRAPLTVGGKLKDQSTVATASDQWNGMVDSAFLTIRS